MKKIFTLRMLLFSVVLLAAGACHDNEKVLPSCDGAHWDYSGIEGPGYWKDICVSYGNCGGLVQSPVEVKGATLDNTLSAIAARYSDTEIHILNNGHTFQFNQDAGSEMEFNGTKYELAQFHFHTPSEHTLNGVAYPLEVHFVHKNATTGQIAVIAVMVKEGAVNGFLTQFLSHLPAHEDEEYESTETYNAGSFLPADLSYNTYDGSLTTPPCSENVTWIVLDNPVEASPNQIGQITNKEPRNNRPLQQLNGRVIRRFEQ